MALIEFHHTMIATMVPFKMIAASHDMQIVVSISMVILVQVYTIKSWHGMK